jgi:acetyl-CoA carboxylase carboxyl transferase alpha subunit/acetyl-CoA carboxylase carboxyl transferase beta subunit
MPTNKGVAKVSVGQATESVKAPLGVAEENRWIKCPRDGAFVYHKRLERNLKVCPECNYHFRISAGERLRFLVDPDSFQELSGDLEPCDPLEFVDSRPYTVRVQEAQKKTGRKEGATYGIAAVMGSPLVVAVMEFGFIGGAMGSIVGEVITRAAELAALKRLPLLIISASGGARMQEGCISLMQMVKTSAALALLGEQRLPCFVFLTDPTYGGVSASFATLGDILIAEPDAMIGFAGRSVIESTIKQQLPDDFQRSDFLLEHGMIDMIVPRGEFRRTLGKLLTSYRAAVSGRLPLPESLPEVPAPLPVPAEPKRDVWELVQMARNPDRPNALEYIARIFTDFHRMHGDRLYGEDAAILGGLARLGDVQCMVLGTMKGRSIAENIERNFGMPNPEGYRKALRLMQHAAKFHMPIIALVDTPGAYPGLGAEERGQSVAIARNLLEMARFPVPIITVLTGEGGSGGALALAVADRVLILENAYYSVISPEGCSVILFKNVSAAPQAAKALRITGHDLKRHGVVDDIVAEPAAGAHTDVNATAENLKSVLVGHLRQLLAKDPQQLLTERYARYRKF